jgi:uncharacterized membrane protein
LSARTGLAGRPPIVHLPHALRPRAAAWLGCHGIPDRCLAIGAWRSPICARCVGLLAGYPAAIVALFLFGPPAFGRAAAGALLLVPAAIDGGRQMLSGYRSTTARRFVTGALAGFGQLELLGGLTAALLGALAAG